MAAEKTNIGNAKMKGVPMRPLSFMLKDKAVKNKHLDDNAVNTRVIEDKAVTPNKLSSDVQDSIVKPITNSLDEKYTSITNDLYEMIESISAGGIALLGKFGERTDMGINQKTLTDALYGILRELSSLTGKTYMDYTMTVNPTFIVKEGTATTTVTADSSEAMSNFDSIKFYVNDVLRAESYDVTVYTQDLDIDGYGFFTIKAEGVIFGKKIVKEMQVNKVFPFFMGSGQEYTEILVPECAKELIGTLEGDYDVTIRNTGDYMFIVIPISHKDEFRRADMNGLGLKVEIPMQATETADYVVYKSINTYQAGTYNIDIDINS